MKSIELESSNGNKSERKFNDLRIKAEEFLTEKKGTPKKKH